MHAFVSVVDLFDYLCRGDVFKNDGEILHHIWVNLDVEQMPHSKIVIEKTSWIIEGTKWNRPNIFFLLIRQIFDQTNHRDCHKDDLFDT